MGVPGMITIQTEGEPKDFLVKIQRVMDEISELHRVLSECPDDGGDTEAELLRLITQRNELASALGHSLVRWLAAGGVVELLPAESDTSQTPAQLRKAISADLADGAGNDSAATTEPTSGIPGENGGATQLRGVSTREEGIPAHEPLHEPLQQPVTPAALRKLAQTGLTPNWSPENNQMAPRCGALQGILKDFSAPVRPPSRDEARQTVTVLAAVVSKADKWLEQPQETQRALIGFASSMARFLQHELSPLDLFDERTFNRLFSQMTRWSGQYQPGFVPGLSRSKGPTTGNWLTDAEQWWESLLREANLPQEQDQSAVFRRLEDLLEEGKPSRTELVARVRDVVKAGVTQSDPRLISLLMPYRNRLKGEKEFKTLRTKLRKASQTERVDDDPEKTVDHGIPADWNLFERTRGKSVVIVGGDDRSHAAARIKDAFGFRDIEWETGAPRRAAALAERVRGGRTIDMIIVLRNFVSHSYPNVLVPACKEAGVDLVVVDHGYGVSQVKLAMERFLG